MTFSYRSLRATYSCRSRVRVGATRHRLVTQPEVQALEGRALMASIQILNSSDAIGVQTAYGAFGSVPAGSYNDSINNLNTDQDSNPNIGDTGGAELLSSSPQAGARQLGINTSENFQIPEGDVVTVSNAGGTQSGGSGQAFGSSITVKVVPSEPSESVGQMVDVTLAAGYESLGGDDFSKDYATDQVTSLFKTSYQYGSSSPLPIIDTTVTPDARSAASNGDFYGGNSVTFKAAIGDTFTVSMSYQATGNLDYNNTDGSFAYVNNNDNLSLEILATSSKPDIVATSASFQGPQSVKLNYSITGGDLSQPFQAGIYRSPTPTFDASTAVATGIQTTIPATDASGASSTKQGQHTVSLTLPSAIGPDPGGNDPYLFAVANPPGSSHISESDDPTDANNAAALPALKIDNLPKNGMFMISVAPEMPQVEAEITGLPAGSAMQVNWTETIQFVPSDDPHAPANTASTLTISKQTTGPNVTFTQADVPPGKTLQGGRLSIKASYMLNGQQVNLSFSDGPGGKPLRVGADNPSETEVTSYLNSLGTPSQAQGQKNQKYNFIRIEKAIIKHESGGGLKLNQQFLPSNGYPVFNVPKGRGVGDGGVGLMQITYHVNALDRWNWKQNVHDGYTLLSGNVKQAAQHFQNSRKAMARLLPGLAKKYKVHAVTIEVPTADDLILNAVSLFGPNSRFYQAYATNPGGGFQVAVTGNVGVIELKPIPNDYVSTILKLY